MSEAFLHLPRDEQANIFEACTSKLGRRPEHLEKDVWICWALQSLFAMPQSLPMAFKGGTSLSKIFDAIRRFSEDVDVTIDYRALDATVDPFAPDLSKTTQKKFSENLKARVKQHTHDVVLPYFAKLLDPFATRREPIELSEDGESMRIYYPSVYGNGENVLLEFGGRNVVDPSEQHFIRPYIAQEIKELDFPTASVRVLSPVRTFWEKATLIHVECHRPEPRVDASRLSRHWSDLAVLADHEIGKRSLSDRSLLAEVVKHKKVFFHTATANYDACLGGGLRLVPDAALLSALGTDFGQMVRAGMFDIEPPAFDKIVSRLQVLEREINGRDR